MPRILIRQINSKLRVTAFDSDTFAWLHTDIRCYKPSMHYADTRFDGDTRHTYTNIAEWEVEIPYSEHGLKALKSVFTHIPNLAVTYHALSPSVVKSLEYFEIIKPPQPTPTMSRETAAAPAATKPASLAMSCCFFGALCGSLLFDDKASSAAKGAILGAIGGAILDDMQLTKKNN